MAEKNNIPLVDEVLGKLLKDRNFKSDQIHLNAAGYRKLAEAIAEDLYALRAI